MTKKGCQKCGEYSTFTAIINVDDEEIDVCPECFVDFIRILVNLDNEETIELIGDTHEQ